MMMAPSDMLDRATEAECQAAKSALKAATSLDELTSIWWRDCERFEGEPRARLQATYTRMLHKFAPMGRAG